MRRYTKEDISEMTSWFLARGKEVSIRAEDLPPTGLIEPGVAVGFLYKTDGNIAYIENLLTNPEASGRFDALTDIFKGLLALAKQAGKTAVVTTVSSAVLENIASALGFESHGDEFNYLVKRL